MFLNQSWVGTYGKSTCDVFFSGKFLGPKILGVILSIMQHHRNSDSLDSGYIQIYRSAFAQQNALKIKIK